MNMRYRRCCYLCEEEIVPGEEYYSGMKGYYHRDCLNEMSAVEFLQMEMCNFDIAEDEYFDDYDDYAHVG